SCRGRWRSRWGWRCCSRWYWAMSAPGAHSAHRPRPTCGTISNGDVIETSPGCANICGRNNRPSEGQTGRESMAYDWQTRVTARPATWADVDAGLRQYMLRVYNYMGAGLALTGIVAYVAAASGFYQAIYRTPLMWLVILAPLGMVFFLSFRIQRMSLGAAQTTFWIYAGSVGLSLAGIFLVYTRVSIASTFFITAAKVLGTTLYR